MTSLVAVDQTPSRPDGEPLKLVDLPINLPAGWDFEKVFGERARPPAPPTERRAETEGHVQVAALKSASLRQPPIAAPVQSPATVTLAKTATDAELSMILGAMLMAFSLMLLALNRRRASAR